MPDTDEAVEQAVERVRKIAYGRQFSAEESLMIMQDVITELESDVAALEEDVERLESGIPSDGEGDDG